MTKQFSQTSNNPYVRHNYKLTNLDSGDETIFDNFEDMRVCWFQQCRSFGNFVVTVLDKKPNKKVRGSGFGK